MKLLLISLLAFACLCPSYGQSTALFSSVGVSQYFDLKADRNGRDEVNYKWRDAYSCGASYMHRVDQETLLNLALSLRHVKGYYVRHGGSLVGSYTRKYSFSKTSLGVAVYSLCSSAEKHVQFQIGMSMAFLLSAHMTGKSTGQVAGHVWDVEISDFNPKRFNLGIEGGLRTKLLDIGKHRLDRYNRCPHIAHPATSYRLDIAYADEPPEALMLKPRIHCGWAVPQEYLFPSLKLDQYLTQIITNKSNSNNGTNRNKGNCIAATRHKITYPKLFV